MRSAVYMLHSSSADVPKTVAVCACVSRCGAGNAPCRSSLTPRRHHDTTGRTRSSFEAPVAGGMNFKLIPIGYGSAQEAREADAAA